MPDHSANAGRHPHKERGIDLYETPPEATIALLKHEQLPFYRVWEPCCGPGAIGRVLIEAGYKVLATDITDYGGTVQTGLLDFLKATRCPAQFIITNPPFNQADKFVRHALKLAPERVIMLLPSLWRRERGPLRVAL